jgi:hypothetical protein
VRFQGLRHSIGIDHIIAKAVDVLGSIRAQCARRVHVTSSSTDLASETTFGAFTQKAPHRLVPEQVDESSR